MKFKLTKLAMSKRNIINYIKKHIPGQTVVLSCSRMSLRVTNTTGEHWVRIGHADFKCKEPVEIDKETIIQIIGQML